MKRQFIASLFLCAFAAASPTLATAAAAAHDHGAAVGQLQLNAGKKWATDAPLRQGMGSIRQAMAHSLHAIHANRMTDKEYAALSLKIKRNVEAIVAGCKLPPDADAQLHIVVAELLDGAEQMAGKPQPMDGAIKVIGALDNYGKYFNDPGFKPIRH